MMYDETDIEVEAIKAEIACLKATNDTYSMNGEYIPYGEDEFFPLIERLKELLESRRRNPK